MSSEPEIVETQLTLHFGATLSVTTTANGFSDFIKPAASFSTKWKGIPSEDQVKLATQFIQHSVLGPTLDDIIATAQQRLIEARRGR
ncbi:hypothetical protein [Mycolicibacter kumamotonensis]|uniref:Uncharacterized protein n=1 Tax=Mycolicibacter kumamotonensis TaxID=354243 RepID=A0A1B8SLC4_9MYCO|nr:hypothetical protein [Mycolicibacter kumamotonensis]OBY33504.1 hypothetical protein ACT18_00745 [Mycolicibacter kumamotonensis]